MNAQKNYWDKNIEAWSRASYEKRARSPIEMAANLFRGGIKGRMEVAIEVVQPLAERKIVLDLGCGLGDFCFGIANYKPRKIIGVDISEIAIREAQERAKKKGVDDLVQFMQGDAAQMKTLPPFDIVVGLGFIDYLKKEELGTLFKLIDGRHFLFSMFEKKLSWLNLLHAIYVRAQKCPGSYKYAREEMKTIVPRDSKFYFLEKNGMLFITNLPK